MGESEERVLAVLVSNEREEREEREEMEEDGVWALCDGGGVVNVSCLRSSSNGELDGDREGA
jgi:hypothetical protein